MTNENDSIIKELCKLYEEDEEAAPELIPGPSWQRDVVISVRDPGRVPPPPSHPPSSPDIDSDGSLSSERTASPTLQEELDSLREALKNEKTRQQQEFKEALQEPFRLGSLSKSEPEETIEITDGIVLNESPESDDHSMSCLTCKSTEFSTICKACHDNEKSALQGDARHEYLMRAKLENKALALADQNSALQSRVTQLESEIRMLEQQDSDEALSEARVVIDRQCKKIEELTAEVKERKERYFDNIEDLAEGKMVMKQQQKRIEELFDEVNSEKRNRTKAEGWLMQLRDECIRLKTIAEERDKMRDDMNSILYLREEVERKYRRLKDSYHQLWDRNEELETVFQRKDVETEKLRAGWEYTSQELYRVQGCVKSLQNYNDHLKCKLREHQAEQQDKYAEALAAVQLSPIDELSDTHIDALTGNLTRITSSALGLFFPTDVNPSTTIKKLMAKMHPDRTTIPACKETLQKRFQLLNHLKSLVLL
eukprot:TRINITY_DN31973_c0_g1_i1.p1 TRINITY_DN31973_c0_g1~~TRINITY_DN31973_c0_g1_i1.p1  ORF type:complete len:503 (+),score=118.61 TRINITY_DN31973_c0_g1_i1:61-1509(+)